MRLLCIALAFLIGGFAVLAATFIQRPFVGEPAFLGWGTGGVLSFIGLTMLVTASRRRAKSPASLRLDVFLPFLVKRKKNALTANPTFILRVARSVLPPSWFADQETGKPGKIRKVLKKLGPTVSSAPLRRAVQAVCLLLFLYLFFYVCWPYTAAPAPPGERSPGWRLLSVDQTSGEVELQRANPLESLFATLSFVHVVDENADPVRDGYTGVFRLHRGRPGVVVLTPQDPVSPEMIEAFLMGVGPWAFYESEPGRWPSHYADDLSSKERVPAEVFLMIDPLVSLSTAIAARSWVWSLISAATILLVCVLIPRGFCGYLCPLGTLIDVFDWGIARRVKRFRIADNGWWVHIKYYLLLAVLVCAVFGVLVSGYVAAIPVVTRGMLFLGEPIQSGVLREWRLVPPLNAGHWFSIALFLGVLGLGFLQPRFWCKYVCPSGAVFSLANLFRVTERKVESSCIHCNKCVEICPFDAIKPDFTTRVTDCTLCQTCGGVCPTHAIKFVERWNKVELKVVGDPPTGETSLGRRGFLSLAAGSASAILGGSVMALATRQTTADIRDSGNRIPVRPPGSVPEREFLQLCIRCGECFKACPNNVLQPMGLRDGLNQLWTPQVVADWAGCEPSCNACGQVCPTGAIRALPLAEKKAARMGLAIVNQQTCLPFAGREACQLCVDECTAAGYHAIEFTQVHTAVDASGQPTPGSGFLAPVILADQCVGCGVCQTRCFGINVAEKGLLQTSAIVVEAGDGKEDRMMDGSYRQLRAEKARQRDNAKHPARAPNDYFVPELADPQSSDAEWVTPENDASESPF
jgi:ferredoxin